MKGSPSRLLQVVVAAMLINVAPDGRAETYDLRNVRANEPDGYGVEGAYLGTDYDNWDLNDYSERSGSGDDEPVGSEELTEEQEDQCDAISAKVDSTCDLRSPPLLVVNGCGSGVTTKLVPDYLTVNGVPVYMLGPIFEGACNEHDVCYGTHSNNKEACDMTLYTDMVDFAKAKLTDVQWRYYGVFVEMQALGYSRGLQLPPVSYFAQDAFTSAQRSGACRYYSSKAKQAGCLGS